MIEPRFFKTPRAFRQWLEVNAARSLELIVGYHKLASGRASMSYSDSVDEALCVGWIDGIRKRIDDQRYAIRFTPRRASSIWSAVNIAKVERLRAEQRMTACGEQAFALRSEKKSAIYAHELISPPALSLAQRRMFKRRPCAWKFFETTPPGYQKLALYWVTSAKKEDTRAARLSKLIEASIVGKRCL
jgi:uncharacterized protein YdeI (YjbR/CyaY-like superfamily)